MKLLPRTGLGFLFQLGGWSLFIAAIGWPTLALIIYTVLDGKAPEGGYTFTSRQWSLIGQTCCLSLGATVFCHLIALVPAYLLGRSRSGGVRFSLMALAVMVLINPPMVCAFGWERILPADFDPTYRCILVWSLWLWPIPALLLGGGWFTLGKSAYEAALMNLNPFGAFFRVVLPVLSRHIIVSGLLVFMLCLNDYGVPHACGLMVYATDLLGWAAGSTHIIDTLWPASLGILITLACLLILYRAWLSFDSASDQSARTDSTPPLSVSLFLFLLCLFLVSWVLPLGTLFVRDASMAAMRETINTYGYDLVVSLLLAMVAATLSLWLGFVLATVGGTFRILRQATLVWAILLGALPGALVGIAMVSAYNHAASGWIYDNWPIVVVCYLARFGWVGALTGWLVANSGGSALIDQARTDGATDFPILTMIRIPMNRSLILGGWCVIVALSLAESAASGLVQIPGFTPISLILIEKFHRFEDGILVSLCFCLVVVATVSVGVLSGAIHSRKG